MPELPKRELLVEVDTIKIQASNRAQSLRVAFSVERDDQPYPNAASISIYNLTPRNRERLASKTEVTCRIEAGYENKSQQIFFGTLRRARTTREGPDYVTRLESGDGEEELQTATVNKTWAANTPISAVLTELGSALGLGPGNIPLVSSLAILPSGATLLKPLTLSGPVVEELKSFCASVGLSFSVQAGQLQLLALASPVLPGTAVLLSPATGLIGEARLDVDSETKKTICVARSLLQPQLLPGSLFAVASEAVVGSFAAKKTRHFGDTHAQDWYVDVEGTQL